MFKNYTRLHHCNARILKRYGFLLTIPLAMSGFEIDDAWSWRNKREWQILFAYLFLHLATAMLRQAMKVIDESAKDGIPMSITQQQDLILQDLADWAVGGQPTPLLESWFERARSCQSQLRLLSKNRRQKIVEKRSLKHHPNSQS